MPNPLLDTSSLPRFGDIAPEHVVPAVDELIAEHRRRLASLLDEAAPPDFNTLVAPLEAMDHELSRVWSPVRHLNGVLGSAEWRDAYTSALPALTEHATELAQNERLQQAYAAVKESFGDDASESQRSVVEHALRDFHLSGVDLPVDRKARFKEIMQRLAKIQSAFEHNVQDASDAWSLPVDDAARLSGLPPQAMERAAAEARRCEKPGWLLTLDWPTYDVVMRHADDGELRETLYRAWVTRASDEGADPKWDNSSYIAEILALRHEAAGLVGFANYAEYSLATKMAGTPDEVIAFLRELATRSRPKAESELAELTELAGRPLAAWDTAYWLEKLKQKKYSISAETLRKYFPARKAVNGLFHLAERLYGIRIEREDGIPAWHGDVVYFVVRSAAGERLGGFYTDLFARPGKRTGAWIDECASRMRLNGETVLPTGYLVCNFPPAGAGHPSLLAHEDVVTLFHEFGHMLHHLLTRIDYPSIAGINGVPWDAVELPSQFMESFAWHYEVLAGCSAHVDSGEPLPESLFHRLEDSRHAGAALAMLRQLEFALFDFRLHAEYDPERGPQVLETMDGVRREIALVPQPDYNRLSHNFAHVFAGGYAAGYYSYKWAEVLAADAFAAFEEAGIFDPDTAARFRREILEIGGSRDIMQAYIAFRGRKPDIRALLRRSGIAAE